MDNNHDKINKGNSPDNNIIIRRDVSTTKKNNNKTMKIHQKICANLLTREIQIKWKKNIYIYKYNKTVEAKVKHRYDIR